MHGVILLTMLLASSARAADDLAPTPLVAPGIAGEALPPPPTSDTPLPDLLQEEPALPPEPPPPPPAPAAPVIPAPAPVLPPADGSDDVPRAFRQGTLRGSGGLASFDSVVLIAGLGVFALDGLFVGLQLGQWLGEPLATDLIPELRYVFWMVPVVQPFLGGHYKRSILWEHPDVDFIGARAGVEFVTKSSIAARLGAVYERRLACKRGCDGFFPELTLGVSFSP